MNERELFPMVSRDERQEECRQKWVKNKCCGIIEAATGFGKTRIGLNCAKSILKVYPSYHIIVVVPTETLKNQWTSILDNNLMSLNSEVIVINTVVKNKYKCDLLILDD